MHSNSYKSTRKNGRNTKRKLGKDKDRLFVEEEVETVKKCEEWQIKTVERYYLFSIRLEKIKKLDIATSGGEVGI